MQSSNILDGGRGSGGNPGTGARKRPVQVNEDENEEEEKPLILSTLFTARKENREEIAAQVREDVDGLSCRVVAVEQTVAQHVTQTMKLLEAMTERHCAMEQNVKTVGEKQESLLERLELLEGKFAKVDFQVSSTRTSDSDGGNHRPALIAGGLGRRPAS